MIHREIMARNTPIKVRVDLSFLICLSHELDHDADILPEESRAMLFGTFDALMDFGLVAGPSACFTFLAFSGLPIKYSFLLMAVSSIAALPLILRMEETKA